MIDEATSMTSLARHDGLACYATSKGKPLFLMPYPHGFGRAPIVQEPLPALICVGRHDPQAPVGCSEELAQGIPSARLVTFEHSGHYPFTEERDLFQQILAEFLA